MQTDPDESTDEIDGLMIHSTSTPDRLFEACRDGRKDDVAKVLRTWGSGFPGGRALPAQALLEAIAWARVDIVRLLLDRGASVIARGKVSTPGGSGVVDEDTAWVNGAELCRMMVSAGLRPRRALSIAKLVEDKTQPNHEHIFSSTSADDEADEPTNNHRRKGGRVVKRPRRFEAGPSRRARLRTADMTPVIEEEGDDADEVPADERSVRASTRSSSGPHLMPAPPARLITLPPPATTPSANHRLAASADMARISRMPSERTRACADVLTTMPSAMQTSREASSRASPAMLIEAVAVCDGDELGEDEDGVVEAEVEAECCVVGADDAHDTRPSSGGAYAVDAARVPFGAPGDDMLTVQRLEASVRELRQKLDEQGQILAEQNALLQQLYQAGVAAATVLQPRRVQ